MKHSLIDVRKETRMRIGHASKTESNDSGWDGKAKAGDQTGKEVTIAKFYKKPWYRLLRCKDSSKAELMAKACETMCNNNLIGYDQSQRLTLHRELERVGFDYNKITAACETDCSAFMTACAYCSGIKVPFVGTNAPTTANMVEQFKKTGMFDVLTDGINEEYNLRRGDILVGQPSTHTVMVLDNGSMESINKRRTLKKGMKGSDVLYMQTILHKLGYDLGKWGCDSDFGNATYNALLQFQKEHFVDNKEWDGICGLKTWTMLEKYV